MDTDSFFLEFNKDPYKIIKENIDEFDTSDYSKDHECYNDKNKKVIGKFKDELNGIILKEYCGLRSKCYSYLYDEDDKNDVKCKGIKKNLLMSKSIKLNELDEKERERLIKMDNFKTCLFEDKEEYREMYTIRSYKHELFTICMNKLALSNKDGKRYILENKIDTLPWGHTQAK